MSSKKNNSCLVRTIRQAMGMTSEELTHLTGLKYATVHRAEIGRAIRPEASSKIADVLKIDADIVSYSTGVITKETIDLIKKDPLLFKELVNEYFSDPSKLTKTEKYIEEIKSKMKQIRPDLNKMLSKVKPSKQVNVD